MEKKPHTLKQALKGKLTTRELKLLQRAYDVIGSIAIIEIPRGLGRKEKLIAAELLKHKNILTVVKKASHVRSKLRTRKLKIISGENTKETLHRESGCLINLNVETCYFSPRLGSDRLDIAKQVKRGERIAVLFAGVGPYALVIAKNSQASEIITVELNKQAVQYAKKNIRINKLDNIEVIQGDVKKVASRLARKKFDRIVMPRPQLPETFLKEAFMLAKHGTVVHFHDFLHADELRKAGEKIKQAAKLVRKKMRILKIKKVGEIAPYKYRVRIDFKIL